MASIEIKPKQPDSAWLDSYFAPSLLKAQAYKIDTPEVEVKLDQNESPWDWPQPLKDKILAKVSAKQWNRYPEPQGEELNRLLGEYVGVPESSLITAPGSNTLIPLILDAMARNLKGDVIIARPTFALFEMHCNYAGINYRCWDLDQDFNYQTDDLSVPEGSLVVFASPNNPTGTSLSQQSLDQLLEANPNSFFLADEAYYEFNDQPYIELLNKHSNLLILRTMSKTMGAAGIRLGYLVSSELVIQQLAKLRLPYMLNHFSMEAAKVILSDPEMKSFVSRNIENAISERQRVLSQLEELSTQLGLRPIPSKANFLLIQWPSQEACQKVYDKLVSCGVLVRNVSKGPGLSGCLRISIGTKDQNDRLISALKS